MSSPQSCRRIIIVTSLLLIVTVAFLWLEKTKSSNDPSIPQSLSETKSSPEPSPEGDSRTSEKHATPSAEIVDSEESWDIDPGGNPTSIKLALDEANLRDAEGKESITRLSPPATQETLPARLAQLTAPGGVFPVAYLVGEERSVASRRIITPDLRVQLDPADAEKIASKNRLKIKDRPSYAPGWVILSAADAFAALDAMVRLRTEREVTSADVLLAAQQSLRAMPNDPLVVNQWHIKNSSNPTPRTDVNIDAAWNYPATSGIRGTGIRIGIVDDGMQTSHPDLSPNADTTNDKDWNGNDSDPSPGPDDDHGTACAGNAGARGNNGLGVTGTAPLATLVGMRLIAASNTDAQEAEALNYLPDLIQIKSNSWGPSDTGTILAGPAPLTLAALRAAATTGRGGKGNIILWAGGNGGSVGDDSNYDGYANSIYTIAIGATDSAGNRSYYSEPGSNLIVCAPSSGTLGITTTDQTDSLGYNTASTASGGDYTNKFGGTSSSTPTAAGIVALMLEKNPNLGWRDVQEILVKSAFKFKPTDSGWATNTAGYSFNHNFGAGLIDATAAVNLAATWVNLVAQTSVTSTQTGINTAIPENSTVGVTRTFNLSTSSIRVEHVTLKLSATHTARGNLNISLTSPSGMVSKLAEVHGDAGDNYSNWTFCTVRNWGELSQGTWTLKVTDLSSTNNTTGGTLTAAELTIFGTPGIPVNTPPLVKITQPTNNQLFAPGTQLTVNLTATDSIAGGSAGIVSQVRLLDNNILIATLTTAPYSFTYSPTLGAHTLIASATDSEGAIGTSTSVSFTLVNQAPIMTGASLSASGQNFTDVPLTVSSITASDPENSPLTYTYQWQSSINQTVFTNVEGAVTQTAPTLAGHLLRCVVTASDGNTSSSGFTTAAVNQLLRPGTSAATASAYSYSSGLVLRGSDSLISRQAIIHEFSQGRLTNSEWIEILTLRSGSLALWTLADDSGDILQFRNSAVWNNIPVGTLIVIYNGASKDPLIPADDFDSSDGRMIISSANTGYFDNARSPWTPFGNTGDSIYLKDPQQAIVHSLAFGNSTTTTPNIGSVTGGRSAYFTGDADAKANMAANWRLTTSYTARNIKTTRAPGDLFFSEYVEGSSNNKALEIYNPTIFSVNLATAGYKIEFYVDGSANASSSLILTGILAPNSTYIIKNNTNTGAIAAVPAQLASSYITFNGDDTILLKKGTVTVDAFGQVGKDPGLEWNIGGVTTLNKTLRRKPTINQGDIDSSNLFDPSLEWDAFNIDTVSGLGSHSLAPSLGNSLIVTVTPTTFAENLGSAAATATINLPAAVASPVIASLASSDTGEFTVPATVTIAAGQTSSPSFAITAVDDSDTDGPQFATLTASAVGYLNGAEYLTITDNEPSVEGVTPGAANNVLNTGFVSLLRSGSFSGPARFRIGAGSVVPTGLSLNSTSGLLSGTIAPSNANGPYPIVIERFNSLGETVSQSFTLTIVQPPANTFSAWIGSFPSVGGATKLTDDFDGDGLPNGIENFLGTSPASANPGLTQVSSTPTTLVFRHTRSNTPAPDLVPSYEWSADLVTWNASAVAVSGTTVNITPSTITDAQAPANDLIEVTATVSGTPSSPIFVRLKTVK